MKNKIIEILDKKIKLILEKDFENITDYEILLLEHKLNDIKFDEENEKAKEQLFQSLESIYKN